MILHSQGLPSVFNTALGTLQMLMNGKSCLNMLGLWINFGDIDHFQQIFSHTTLSPHDKELKAHCYSAMSGPALPT